MRIEVEGTSDITKVAGYITHRIVFEHDLEEKDQEEGYVLLSFHDGHKIFKYDSWFWDEWTKNEEESERICSTVELEHITDFVGTFKSAEEALDGLYDYLKRKKSWRVQKSLTGACES